MARPKRARPITISKPEPPIGSRAADDSRLRAVYRLGLEVERRCKGGLLTARIERELREKTGYSADHLRKARVFANRYTRSEFEELCSLRTPQGVPLSWTLVRRLLVLPAGKKRASLQRLAARDGLTPDELVSHIPRSMRRGRKGHPGGRFRKHPKTIRKGLEQISELTEKWARRNEHVWAGSEWLEGKPGYNRAALAKRLRDVAVKLHHMSKAASRLGKRLTALAQEIG